MVSKKPIGSITRGTTNPNRLRRVDRYITQLDIWKKVENPIAVDLGYGRSPVTAVELLNRLQKVNPKAKVIGIEIDPVRVMEAQNLQSKDLVFVHGGFEIPIPSNLDGRTNVDLIRVFNVLRQYDESKVKGSWELMQSRLSENGWIVEGTSDEIGRVSSWITLDRSAPRFFSISLRLSGLTEPSKVAERLPKALIHKNSSGNRIHAFLKELDLAWAHNSGYSSFGGSQRFEHTAAQLIAAGWPIHPQPKRWKLGEITIDYEAVAP